MSNEEKIIPAEEVKGDHVLHPKPEPKYELLEANENNRLATLRKIMAVDFKLDDLLNFITEAESDKAKSHAMVQYNDSIIENIKGFHADVIEYYDALAPEKQSAFLLFAKAVTEREKHVFQVRQFTKEIEGIEEEIAEIETALGLKSK